MDTLEQIFEAILAAVMGAPDTTQADYALAGPA
jgi:hypothetical protein